MNIYIPTIVLIIIGALGVNILKRHLLYIKRGWKIRGHGRDEMEYVERENGSFYFGAELMGRGKIKRIISLPTTEECNEKTPIWAHGRRNQIVEKIKSQFPQSKYKYE